jgi:hypothetical protein
MMWDAPHHRPPSRTGAARLLFFMFFVVAVVFIPFPASPGRHHGRWGPRLHALTWPGLATPPTIPAMCRSSPACESSFAHPGISGLLQAVPGLAARPPPPSPQPGGWLCHSCPAFGPQFCSPCSLLPQPAQMDAELAHVDVATAALLGTHPGGPAQTPLLLGLPGLRASALQP